MQYLGAIDRSAEPEEIDRVRTGTVALCCLVLYEKPFHSISLTDIGNPYR